VVASATKLDEAVDPQFSLELIVSSTVPKYGFVPLVFGSIHPC
jgi:hypothetical protein